MEGEVNARVTLSRYPVAVLSTFKGVLDKKWMRSLKEKGTRRVLSFDFDSVPMEGSSDMVKSFSGATGLPLDGFHAQHTGNGVHFHIPLTDDLSHPDYEVFCSAVYRKIYVRIANAVGLPAGKRHRDVQGLQSWNRFARAPLSRNVKDGKESDVVPLAFCRTPLWSWQEAGARLAGDRFNLRGVLERERIKRMADEKPRAEGVETPLVGCRLVKRCADSPADVDEPLWFDLLRILSPAPNGREVAHLLSSNHPNYSVADTDAKFDHAKAYVAPTCALMEERHGKCQECPHWRKIRNPSDLLAESRWKAAKEIKFRKIDAKGNLSAMLDIPLFHQYLAETLDEALAATEDRHKLLHWEGNVWSEMGDLDVMAKWVSPLAGYLGHGTVSTLKNLSLELRTERRAIPQSTLAGQPGLIYLKDGILDILSGEPLPHSPSTSASHVLPIKRSSLDPSEKADERWAEYLTSLLGEGEDGAAREAVLQEHVGSALAGALPTGSGRALYVYGETRNGKSEFIKIIRGLLHPSQTAGVSLSNLRPNALYGIRGALLAYDSDCPTHDRSLYVKDDSVLKKIITGEPVEIKELYSDVRQIVLRAKLFAFSNGLPTSVDKTGGFYRRFTLLKFPNYFPEGALGPGDRLHEEILHECRSSIYRWAVEGYKRLLENGGAYSESPDHRTMLAETKSLNDPIYGFLEERVDVLLPENDGFAEASVPISNLYVLFQAWLEQEGFRTYNCSKNRFSRRVSSHLHGARPSWQARNPTVKMKRTGQKTARHFVGMKMKPQG